MRTARPRQSAPRTRRRPLPGRDTRWRRRHRLSLEPLETRHLLSGTPQLFDLNVLGASEPSDFVQVGDITFFVADDGYSGRELWKTDGTAAGTVIIKDISPGTTYDYYSESYVPRGSNPTELTEVDGTLFFVADDGINGQELWKSDGTTSGTVLVKDINPGNGYQYPYGYGPLQSFPRNLTNVDGTLFFSAEDSVYGGEVWKSDGTETGTVLVKDIHPGTFSDNYGTYPNSSNPDNFANVDGTLFFTAEDDTNGTELWKSDGTSTGTVLVKDIYPGTYEYSYSGTVYGVYPNSSAPAQLTAVDGTLFFLAQDGEHGAELWKSDGTSAGTVLVKDVNVAADYSVTGDSPLIAVNGMLLFAANDGVHGDELWRSDGTSAGTVLVKDIDPGSDGRLSAYAGFTEVDGTLFFSADDGSSGKELWKSDGTEAGTVLVKDINSASNSYGAENSYPFYMENVNGTLFFSAYEPGTGRELWQSDGTETGTVLVADAMPGYDGLYPNSLALVNGTLVFSGDDGGGRELWLLELEGEDFEDSVQLTIYVDSQQVTIPANIGVDGFGETTMAYTVDATGRIMLDSRTTSTLGDFFDIWQTNAGLAGNNPDAELSATALLGHDADTSSTVKMFVNGETSEDYDNHILRDGDEIVLVYGENPVVSLNTNFGPIVVELFEPETPGTVDNFLNYVNDGDYISSFFHRSDPGFVIQGGGFTTTSTAFTSTAQFSDVPTDAPITNEPGISNVRGTVAMAKLGGDPDSATSQFFVNLSDSNTFLDLPENNSFTVFAQVLDMTTVDEIASLPVDYSNPSPYGELPVSTSDQLVVVQSIEGYGELKGTKFFDEDGDGEQDASELGVAGIAIYVDANDNGIRDAGEASTVTDVDGRYLLQLDPGTYTIRAELTAGRVATVPTAPESYTVTVEVGRTLDGLAFGETTLSPPTDVDLVATTDSGVSDDDDLTNRNNASLESLLQFEVSGVIDGAEVRVFSDGLQIGSGFASGGTALVTTDGLTSLSDAVHQITATQAVGGGESEPSTSLELTVDSTPPATITTAAPDLPQAEKPYAFDVDSPDEGQAGIEYSLASEPAGMTIEPDTGLIAWTPNADQAVPQSFEILVTDAAGNSASQHVDMTVLGVIPAYPDDYAMDEDTSLVVDAVNGVLANDGDAESGVLSAVVVEQPAHGSLTFNADGSLTYVPDADFFGADSFTYMASDDEDDSNVAKVTINVAGVNDPPVGAADAYTATEDTVLTVDSTGGVLANDVDVDDEPLTATLATHPVNGTVTLDSDGSFSYTSDAEFSGADSFTYVLSDGTVDSAPITVTLTVTEAPDPPTALADSYSVDEDGVLTVDASLGVLANDSDHDGDAITASISTHPANGTVSLSADGSFTYTPNANFFGSDSFTYTASDGTSLSSVATVAITVNSVADPPMAQDDAFDAPNDGSVATLDVLDNDTSDPDSSQTLSITSVTQGASGGTVVINGAAINYTAPLAFAGVDTFAYTIQDSDGLTDTATVSVTVADAADNSLSGFAFVDENDDGVRDSGESGVPGVQITLSGADNSGNAVARSMLTLNDGSYAFDELPAGTYQLTEQQPQAMYDGLDSTDVPAAIVGNDQITNIVLSGGVAYAETNFGETALRVEYVSIRMFLASTPTNGEMLREVIAVGEYNAGNMELAEAIRAGADDGSGDGEINTAPVAAADAYTVAQDDQLVVSASSGVLANDTDADGDVPMAVLVDLPVNGVVTLNTDGSFTYTPDTGFNGSDSFTYQANDGALSSQTVTVSITVTEPNETPVAADDAYSVSEDSALTVGASTGVLANDSDPDGDALTATIVVQPIHGTLSLASDGSFTYTPGADFAGADSFSYQASDGLVTSTASTVSITVNPTNDEPAAANDVYVVEEDDDLIVEVDAGVLANDSDIDGDALSVSLAEGPSDGTLTLNADGSFTYSPDTHFNGTDSFTYVANDGVVNSAEATATITVLPVNDAPASEGNEYTVPVNGVLTVDAAAGVLWNDGDVDGDVLTAALAVEPVHGTVVLAADGSFTYTPDTDFHGTDTFTYVANDGSVDSDETTVTIDVNTIADTAEDQYEVDEDNTLTVETSEGVLANDSDLDGDALLAALTSQPEHGVLTLTDDGAFTYVPNPNFNGTDGFRYVANDGFGDSVETSVTITIHPVNDVPEAADDTFVTPVDGGTLTVEATAGVLANDVDVDGDSLTAELVSGAEHGELALNPDGSFTYSPAAGFHGTDSFTYTANDGAAVSQEVVATIHVDTPADAVDDSYYVDEDETLTVDVGGGVLTNDTDTDGDSLTAIVTSEPEHGTLTLEPDGSFTYTPEVGFNGTDSFRYAANDGFVDSAEATVTITVAPLDDAPEAAADFYRVAAGGVLTVNAETGVLANDVDQDGDAITAHVATGPQQGTLTLNADGSFTYTPQAGFHGTDSFTYTANDGAADSAEAVVTIEVNSLPAAMDDEYQLAEDGELTVDATSGVLTNDTDVDGDPLTVTLVAEAEHGAVTLAEDGSFTYTPEADYHGTDSFRYAVSDGIGEPVGAVATIAVVPVNDAPLATDDAYGVPVDGQLTVDVSAGVLSNDTDVEGDPLSAAVSIDPKNGTLVLNTDGSFDYTPNAGFHGTDDFTYTASDGVAQSIEATVTIDVNTLAEVLDDAYTVDEDNTLTVEISLGVLANDTDVDADTLTASLVEPPQHGALTLESDGSFTYLPDADFNGLDSFTYTANDGFGDSIEATVEVTVNPVNDAPVGVDDHFSVPVDGELTVDATLGVLANDVDVDGDALAAALVSQPEHGTLLFTSVGSFNYTPDAGFHGTDTFTYFAADAELQSAEITVTIDVNTLADTNNDGYEVDEDNVLTVDVASGVLANDADVDNDALTVSLVAGPEDGQLQFAADGSFTYTPDADFHGTDTFRYVANDGFGDSAETTVAITVNPVNDVPVAGNDAFTVAVDGELTVDAASGVLANDSDVDGDTLTASVAVAPEHGTLSLNDDGSFTYTPQSGYHGADVFTYTASDGAADSADTTVTIDVNTLAETQDDAFDVAPDAILTVDAAAGVLANDTDVDGDTLTVSVVDEPSHGTLTLDADGGFEYTPAAAFHGADAFTYIANDGFGDSSPAIVNILVNSRPEVDEDAYTIDEDETLTVDALAGVLANDIDIDGDTLTAAVVVAPSHGTLQLAADGSFTYVPQTDFHGTDTFRYVANDGLADSGEAEVTIIVASVNDAPVTNDDLYDVEAGATLNVVAASGVLANDTDADGDPLEVQLINGPGHGSLTIDPDGSFVYTPDDGYQGTDAFTYRVNDGVIDSPAATVTIDVHDGVDDLAEMQLVTTDLDGNPIDSVEQGSQFVLQVFVQDLRPEPTGVFSAYLDILYDSAVVTAVGIDHGDDFPSARTGSVDQEDQVDEIGGVSGSSTPTGGTARLLASVTFTADALGTAQFTSDPADLIPGHEVGLFDLDTIIADNAIVFGTATIDIIDEGAEANDQTEGEPDTSLSSHAVDVVLADLAGG